ncbi:MAG: hypothetical protein ABH869_06090 [Candidatus Omnitrophota bacterium]
MKRKIEFDNEEKKIGNFLKKHPFLKEMWFEREKIFDEAYKKEARSEAKYNKIAQEAGLESVRFAYNEYCFGIDVNDVQLRGTDISRKRLVVHDYMLNHSE